MPNSPSEGAVPPAGSSVPQALVSGQAAAPVMALAQSAATTPDSPPTTKPSAGQPEGDPWWFQRLLADGVIYLDRIRRSIETKLGMNPVPAPPCIGFDVTFAASMSDTNMNLVDPISVRPYKADNPMSGAGNYGTVVAFLQRPRELVEKVLPPELTLEPPGAPPSPTHPMAFTFGQQSAVRALSNPTTMGLQYLESVMIVPRVYLKQDTVQRQFAAMAGAPGTYYGPFNYMPRLYLDQLLPTIVGWALAYAKHWGRIEYTENSLQASTLLTGSPHYRAQFTRGKNLPGVAADCKPLLPWLQMLNAPIVSRTIFGKLLFTKFYWPWHYASVWDVDLKLDVTDSGVPVLPPGQYSFQTVSSVSDGQELTEDFAFVTALGWRLLLPFPREILKPGDGEGLALVT